MISKEALRKIGEAETLEEKQLLCDLYDVSLDWFKTVWPAEQLGIDLLEGRAFLTKVEHQFEPLDAWFDREMSSGPCTKHSIVVGFKSYGSGHMNWGGRLGMAPYLGIGPESMATVDADEVPPSLKEAIDIFKQRW